MFGNSFGTRCTIIQANKHYMFWGCLCKVCNCCINTIYLSIFQRNIYSWSWEGIKDLSNHKRVSNFHWNNFILCKCSSFIIYIYRSPSLVFSFRNGTFQYFKIRQDTNIKCDCNVFKSRITSSVIIIYSRGCRNSRNCFY